MKMSGNSSLAGADSTRLEPWRELFRGHNIYNVIRKAILVAATDSPQEFRRRRDGIVELIYTAPTIPILQGTAAGDGEGSNRALEESDNKGCEVASCTVAPQEKAEDNKKEGIASDLGNGNGDNGMDWLQTLADEMDEETQEINEVLRVKEILLNHHEQSTDFLFESLRRLQLMQLTADKIKGTEIGGAVVVLSKHKSHKIRMLVHEIVKDWQAVVDDWNVAVKATMDNDSEKPLDTSRTFTTEDGLATPPVDIGALYLVRQAFVMHNNVSEFLQGMDGDRIMKTNDTTDTNKSGGYLSSSSRYDSLKPSNGTVPWNKDPTVVQALPVPLFEKRNSKELPARQRSPPRKPNSVTYKKTQEQGSRVPRIRIKIKHSSTEYPPRKLFKNTLDEKKSCEENQGTITRNHPIIAAGKMPPGQVLKMEIPTQTSTWKGDVQSDMNLSETKRKLHGAYQEAENSKRKRAIQVVDLCDITKSRGHCSSPLTTSMNPVVSRSPSMKSTDHINRAHTTNRSQIIRSWEHDRCK